MTNENGLSPWGIMRLFHGERPWPLIAKSGHSPTASQMDQSHPSRHSGSILDTLT